MTETTGTTTFPSDPTSGPAPRYASPRLERPRDSAILGVCTAMARTTGTDVVLWRVLVVVLVFFGGLGFLLYLAGIALIPVEGEQYSLGERLVRGPDRSLSGWQVVLVVLLMLALFGLLADNDGLIAAVVIGGLGVLWWRTSVAGTRSSPPPAHVSLLKEPTREPGTRLQGQSLPYAPPKPRAKKSPLGGVTLSLATLVAGVLLLIGASGEASVPAEVVLAGALATVGLGLVVGSFLGRAPGLVLVALLLSLALGATVGVRPAIDAGIGDRTWTPVASEAFRLGIGDATLDLRSLPSSGDLTTITARVDVGHLLVLLPEGRRVSLHATAGIGNVQLLGVDYDGRRIDERLDVGPPGGAVLDLDLSVRTGMVEVRRG